MAEKIKKMIISMAKAYTATKSATFESVALKFGIGSTTVGKYLNTTLKEIDIKLWDKVQEKKKANIERSRKNFTKKSANKVNNKETKKVEDVKEPVKEKTVRSRVTKTTKK